MHPEQTYDYIIAGAGCAGLSLAMQLRNSNLPFKKVLIIDESLKNKNDRTWCFWTKEHNNWFNPIVFQKWQQFSFKSRAFEKVFHLAPYSYYMIRGIDFYEHCLAALKQDARFEMLTDEIVDLRSEGQTAFLKTKQNAYSASYVFNSAFRRQEIQPQHVNYVQHFKGWLIETPEAVISTAFPVFMDFSVDQRSDCRFVYMLPLGKNKTLVEYTGFSKESLSDVEYDKELRTYLEKNLGLKQFTILETEQGRIPMAESAFVNPHGARVINIGTAGGASKASTGYTFYFIQKQCKSIVEQLKNKGGALTLPEQKKRFSFYDKVLLHVLNRKNIPADVIFTQLFQNNNIAHVLAFLNEESSLTQDLKILNSLPKKEFAAAAIRLFFSTETQKNEKKG